MEERIPRILDCLMADCAFNNNQRCHADAITVGDLEPTCDTYFKGAKKAGFDDVASAVGACKVIACTYNESLECKADGIHVGLHNNHPDCTTFLPV
ncbi:MAG: DUF1540 domain-containing protein [Candidatus Margulisiibacteriota bacterium]|nr:MAG: hypothetical protein A2X43_05025 [Candidatus Margulisbacteria bacterium GWD2_39_127]OGI02368.1 MAG: hypothetical protein A2X42_09445 [Candidatus Margulisbacteria bacterium GWF2_38_17]OGI08501.1 MAG: hypothetical protein A2X41_07235 [Candidatus Margulisbacteria bacterium GWE2_39_32]PZM79013.1 MAG: DUF1540 domain-containing protein [Candidatus Margulisiibacteriota bacterium]HAR64208.1 DUF1540 domain-containing protein [Candidatus Margulisiibacteriota bacterium]